MRVRSTIDQSRISTGLMNPFDQAFQSWDNLKNWHRSPMRLYGLEDDDSGNDDVSNAMLTLPDTVTTASVPQAFVPVAPQGTVTSQTTPTVDNSLFSSLINQVGNIVGIRSGGVVLNPKPGQVVSQASANYALGMNTNTMLMIGAAVLGLFLLAKKS